MYLFRRAAVTLGVAVTALAVAAAPAAAVPSEQDTVWMASAHQSNLAEIAAGTAARELATTQEVRELGAMFVEMHTALDADLTAAAEQLGVALPDAPTPDQQAQLAAVTANQGEAFDTAWIAQQLAAHSASKAAGQKEIAEGEDPTVVGLAQASAPVIQQHLDELEVAADTYGVPSSVPGGSGGQAAGSSSLLGAGMIGAGLLAGLTAIAVSRRRLPSRP